MARMFTKGRVVAKDVVFAEPVSDEINQAVAELNGGLDGNNMPLESVTRTRVVPGVKTTITGPPEQEDRVFASQAYYISDSCNGNETINKDDWQMGWNKFEVLTGTGKTGFVLDFEAVEGMVKGEACIDFEHRQSYFLFEYRVENVSTIAALVKDQHTGELGVFINDVLVARTGPLWIACGRHSYVIPFAAPVASGPVHIDVRWMIDFKNIKKVFSGAGIYHIGINQVYPIQIHSRMLWTRNQYR
jgi:hypothetical protein